jgi:hypothetical protein
MHYYSKKEERYNYENVVQDGRIILKFKEMRFKFGDWIKLGQDRVGTKAENC